MCGTFGIVSKEEIDKEIIKRATDLMAHRGPDDFGIYLNTGAKHYALSSIHYNVGLGHRRLSIIDLSKAGHQPISNEDDSIWIVHNGEVYNFLELREELRAKGHTFKSRTDAEVVIHSYEEWGEDCLQRFNGMFTFAIWDERGETLFIARDRLGIKPLYYMEDKERLIFASEIKAILQIPGVEAEVDIDGLFSVLLFLWIPDPKIMFKNIFKLPAGHYAIFKKGRLTIKKYWKIDAKLDENKPERYYREKLRGLLQRAIKRQMISDVPIGVLLSGGLDSSTILAFMARTFFEPVTAYTIAFSERDKKFEAMPDDSKYAKLAAKDFNANHQEILVDPNIVTLLPKILWHLDEPIADSAAINTYLISKDAKEKGTTVLLNGTGGDEIFGGYRKQLSAFIAQYYRLLPETLRREGIEYLTQKLPVADTKRGFRIFRWLKKFTKNASLSPLFSFIGNSSYYTSEEMIQLLNPDLKFDYLNSYPIQKYLEYFEETKRMDYVNRMCYLDTKMILPSLNLTYSDKAMMAASVEGRPPLIDDEIVNFAFEIPGYYKIHYFNQKYILKKAVEDILPKEVIRRPKAPFGVPLRSWIRNDLAPMVDELLSEENIKRRGYFNYPYVKKIIEDDRRGKEDNAHRLWGLLTIELWLRIFIDRGGSAAIQ